MDWLSYAANLNGQGVALCDERHGDLALEYFKGSLQVMSWLAWSCHDEVKREELAKNLPPTAMMRSINHGISGEVSLSYSSFVRPEQQHRSNSTDKEVAARSEADLDSNENHFVFEKPLNFCANSSVLTDPGQISFCIAVIEFNMALALHLQSRRLGDKSLFNALHVYNYCLEHIAHSGCSIECSQLLLFAALNNKAALLYELSSFQMARNVLKDLSNAIQRCRNTGFLYPIDDTDLEGFLFNVVLLRGVCVAPAA